MIIDLNPVPKIRREPYLDYEFQADLASGAKVLFNDPTLSYNHLVALEINNKLLRFQLVGAQPTMTIPGDDFLVYPSVLPNVDLAYELYAGRLKEILVINSNQAQHEFSFLLETNEVTASLQEDNSIIYKDADDNIVWTIEAPYATDANGSEVPVTMQFDGAQYTVKALPTEDTAYPIKLDPTVAFPAGDNGFFISTSYDSSGSFRCNIGRGAEAQVISSLTVYNQRYYYATSSSTAYTSYTSNGTYATTFYQFYGPTGAAIGAKTPVVVNNATECLATIPVPAGAYTIDFTGTAKSPTSSKSSRNSLNIVSLETTSMSSNWAVGERNLTIFPSGTSRTYTLPQVLFAQNPETTVPVVETYEAPRESSYIAGTYNVNNYRDNYGYVKNCYIDLYDIVGTLISTTKIPYSSTAGETKTTPLTVPKNIRKIVMRGEKYRGVSSYSYAKVSTSIPAGEADYGTFNYVYTLDSDANGQTISPGFSPLPPSRGYETYVRYGSDSTVGHVKTSTITATAGTQVSIKICLLRDEQGRVADTGNVCLLGSSNTPVILNVDTSRKTKQAISSAIDFERFIVVTGNTGLDTSRYLTVMYSANALLDTIRKVINSSELIADTKRNTLATIAAAPDTLRKLLTNTIFNSDTVRKTIKAITSAADSKRRLNKNDSVTHDTIRKRTVITSPVIDAKRSILKSILSLVDTKRNIGQNLAALINLDTVRKVIKSIMTTHDSTRSTLANATPVYDTLRRSTLNNSLNADTKRSTTTTILIESDTRRSVIEALAEIIQLDTKRLILNSIIAKSDLTRCILSATLAAVNTKRRSTVQQALRSDSKRKVTESAQVITKAGRKVTASVLHKLDTNRKVTGYIHISYDTERNAREGLYIIYDTKRIIADRTWPRAKQCTLNIQIQGKHVTIISFKD